MRNSEAQWVTEPADEYRGYGPELYHEGGADCQTVKKVGDTEHVFLRCACGATFEQWLGEPAVCLP